MNRSAAVAFVTVLGACVAASPALAEQNSPQPPTPALVPSAAALGLRPNKPLALAQKEESPSYFKGLLAVVVLAGGAYFVVRKRRENQHRPGVERRFISVRHRVALGHKNELLVVETSGMTLLLGVTPGSIQTLATLDAEADGVSEQEPTAAEPSSLLEPFAARMASLLRSQATTDAPPALAARRESKDVVHDPDDGLEGQAKGLSKLRRIR